MGRYLKALLLSALLAAITPSHANSEPGLVEYQITIEARDKMLKLIEQISDSKHWGNIGGQKHWGTDHGFRSPKEVDHIALAG